MISCLENYIGLLNVTTNPLSGRYVNELPGIDTTKFGLVRKEEEDSVTTAWAKVESRAIRRFEKSLNMWAMKFYKQYSIINNVVTGNYDKNEAASQNANYTGWFFDGSSYYKNVKILIPFVDLYASNTVTSSIRVYNAVTGDLLDTVSHDFTAGINRVYMRKEFPVWKYPKLFVCYDESEVQTIKADDLNWGSGISIATKTVPKASSVVNNNLSGVAGQGLIVAYNLECSLDNYICQRLTVFEELYMYALGVEFCNEVIHSDRISSYTLLNTEEAKELKTFLEGEYEDMVKGTLTGLKIDYNNDGCFECDREINYKMIMP